MLVMDSGLGGLSVVRALRTLQPGLPLTYLADTAGFPYGKRSASEITKRASSLITTLSTHETASPIILACNTLSTLCLADLRVHFTTPIVGTVPAIKPASQQSASRRFTLLATPNTAISSYTSGLIDQFARDCIVDIYGAPRLAAIAESILLGDPVDEQALREELAPAFHADARGKTDCLILGCTHYPLIAAHIHKLAPWPVTLIDSSEAIARRALSLEATPPTASIAYVTAAADIVRYQPIFAAEGFQETRALEM